MKGQYIICIFIILLDTHDDGTAESCLRGIQHTITKLTKRRVKTSMVTSDHQKYTNPSQLNTADGYNPIRITTYYSMDGYLGSEELENLRMVLDRAIRKITVLLSGMFKHCFVFWINVNTTGIISMY